MPLQISNHPVYTNYTRHVDHENLSFINNVDTKQLIIAVKIKVKNSSGANVPELTKIVNLFATNQVREGSGEHYQPLVKQDGTKVWKYMIPENGYRTWLEEERGYFVFNQNDEVEPIENLQVNPEWDPETLLSEWEHFQMLKTAPIVVNDIVAQIIQEADSLGRFI